MNNFVFDEQRHVYTLDGEPLPSVTQIIRPLHDFSAVPPDVLKRAADFGTAVHKTVELYLMDDLDENSLDPALTGCLDAFKSWLSDSPQFAREDPIIETPIYHDRLKYAGTPDLVYSEDTIDLKSRKYNPLTDPIQLAAYNAMICRVFFPGQKKRRAWVLELRQDGSYTMSRAETKDALSRFRFLLDYHNMRKEIEKWKQ